MHASVIPAIGSSVHLLLLLGPWIPGNIRVKEKEKWGSKGPIQVLVIYNNTLQLLQGPWSLSASKSPIKMHNMGPTDKTTGTWAPQTKP